MAPPDGLRRFVLLAGPRTGTTVLLNALADLPRALCYGELFHDDLVRREEEARRHTLGAGVIRDLGAALAVCRDEDDGAGYLEQALSPDEDERGALGARAVGFKLFYHHAHGRGTARAWALLAGRPDVSVLHLVRREPLASHVSYERARRSRVWHSDRAMEAPRLTLDPGRCEEFLTAYCRDRRAAEDRLARDDWLELSYEELSSNFAETVRRVAAHLGLSVVAPPLPRFVKLATRPLSQEIANFDALRAQFRDGPLARFFELEESEAGASGAPAIAPRAQGVPEASSSQRLRK